MAGRINDDDVRTLREGTDISTVIAGYTGLKRAGSRLKGLCPFHSEKTPSFTVDPGRGLFHCFGCDAGGDVYGFLQRIEALSFPEAVERLAAMTGFQLRYEELSPGQRQALGRRTRLAEVLREAAAYFRTALDADDAEPARSYLVGRGLGAAEAERFSLGWAPDRWDGLWRHLQLQGFAAEEVLGSGVAAQGRQGPIDRFRGRIIFPIFDGGGREVVAFGGRVVPDLALSTGPREGTPPKYINSSETDVYKKSATLYGLNWARAEANRRQEVLVVEGYMDVIGLQLAGVGNAVATCGTALTSDHFRKLGQFARKVVLALDADAAGYTAAERARALAEEVGVAEVGVLPLPPGQDPADLAAGGRAGVEAALRGVRTAVEFQIDHVMREADTSTPEARVGAYRRTFPLLAQLGDRFLRYTYISELVAPAVRLSADAIERDLDEHLASVRHQPGGRSGAVGTSDASDKGGAAGAPARSQRPGEFGATRDPQMDMERDVLRVALQRPDLLPEAWAQVGAEEFRAPVSRQLLEALRAGDGDLDATLARLPDDDTRARVRALALSESTVAEEASTVADLVARLRAAALQRRTDELRAQLAQLNERTAADEGRQLSAALFELERRRRNLLEGRQA